MNGEHPDRDDLVAFALGALEPSEEQAVEAHVPGCARCTRELEALVPAVAVLGESVEQVEPPPELRERVLFLLRPAVALTAVAIIAAGVGGYLVRDTGGGGGETTVAVQPAQPGIGGSLIVGDDSSTLNLHGLTRLTGDEVYQVWVAKGSSVRPSSDFVPDSTGRAMTDVEGQLDEGTQVMVTRESAPGHTTPTLPVLVKATVS